MAKRSAFAKIAGSGLGHLLGGRGNGVLKRKGEERNSPFASFEREEGKRTACHLSQKGKRYIRTERKMLKWEGSKRNAPFAKGGSRV